MNHTDYPAGASVWQELEARSADGLAEFYAAVLGWELRRVSETAGVFLRSGTVVAGLRVDPQLDPSRAGWRTYLGAEDLDAATDRAVTAGARVIQRGKQLAVPGNAVELVDPFGALFGLAVLPPGVAVPPSPELGRLSLTDPTNHDVEKQLEFQRSLFPGQASEPVDPPIHFFRDADGTALRGTNEVEPALREMLPPHWLPWFNVADQAQATAAATRAGGRVNTQDNVLSFGRWGVVVDPSGADFKVLQLTVPAL
ncbi:VOC family protein [Georgenia sp. AZ-5]|uniref:VOC family protein n=1 Tax=Georgenia sp. AZ-5 TaxID=3367526 RepID=UPI00375523BC